MIYQGIFSFFQDRFNEGGPVIMTIILLCFLIALVLLVKGFMHLKSNKGITQKMQRIVIELSLLGLVIGFFGSILGLITAFDAVVDIKTMNTNVLAGGLKTSFLSTLFGTLTFIILRIGLLILRWMQPEFNNE